MASLGMAATAAQLLAQVKAREQQLVRIQRDQEAVKHEVAGYEVRFRPVVYSVLFAR